MALLEVSLLTEEKSSVQISLENNRSECKIEDNSHWLYQLENAEMEL
jgi:hypothetical protein